MKRALIAGCATVVLFAAVGMGIAQTQTQTESARGPVFGNILNRVQDIMPQISPQDSLAQQDAFSNEMQQMDSAITCDPPGSTVDHDDISLNWLGFVDAGAISSNTAGGLDVCSQGLTNVQVGGKLKTTVSGNAEIESGGRIDLEADDLIRLYAGDAFLSGTLAIIYNNETKRTWQASIMSAVDMMTAYGAVSVGDDSDPPGITMVAYNPVDFYVDAGLALWQGVHGAGENESEPLAELAVLGQSGENETAYVKLEGAGDSGIAEMGNNTNAAVTVDTNGNVVVKLGS